MPDLRFEAQLDQFLSEFTEQAAHFAPQIAEDVLRDILETSPYWSGRSKASWVFSVDEPVEYVADVPKRAGAVSEGEAKAASLATVSNLANFRLGQTIYLTNGNFYLRWIEEGTWGSNPGFVAAAVSKYMGLVNLEVSL